ncbi:glycerol-3-phosphate acyltransferase 1, mitochondrial-like [Uloborus diversus]|uniref:glycerol-3-phosphate acyltransferase 1, mitochondrial-like n=1 Tax=Uloborus diversus TaxID=327109 RepID=UPI0024098858|nr:glycerol-3-phosphate acyltransferase 1, mitochondrial-like [Uloborus diversus]
MSDLIQNVQGVYKKWEARSNPNFSRPRRGTTARFSSARSNYNANSEYFPSEQRYRKPKERYKQARFPRFSQPRYDNLAQFKMAPCVDAENKPRPFVGTPCLKCLPISKANIQDSSVFCLSVCNVLHIPFFNSACFSLDVSHALNILKSSSLYPDVSAKVLTSESVVTSIQDELQKLELNEEIENRSTAITLHNLAKQLLDKMKSSVSTVCLWFTASILHSVLNKIVDGILVHKGHIEILKTSSQDKIPFVYLPLHRSHLDYILISYILFMNSLQVPLVAAGDNLFVPFFGHVLKLLGAFFIHRQRNQKQRYHLYQAILQSYITESLKASQNLEFFIEGGRSRSGKCQLPKTGLLSMVVKSVLDGCVDDVYIVPVSVSYEKIMEGNFIAEQLGHPKEKESFLSILCSIWRIMHLNYGNVRVNFCQPFSLNEFLKTNSHQYLPNDNNGDTPPESSSSFSSDTSDFKPSNTSKVTHSVVNSLARHVMYDASLSIAVMSTHLVAFLFISQYRKGATQQQLQNSMNWLRGELLNKKRDTGFTGESVPVIKRAIDLLGKDLISTETVEVQWTSSDLENNNVKVTVYTPVVKLPHVLELQYYANSVVPIFLLDSIVVNAVYALVDVEICHFRHCDSKLYVCREKIIEKSIELNSILQFEFIPVPPCADIALSFSDVLDELIERECLQVAGVDMFTGSRVRQLSKKAHVLSFESSDEDESIQSKQEHQLKIDLKEDSIKHLEFLRNILSPIIESYWLSACSLLKLIDEVKEERIFIQEMQLTAQEKLSKGLLAYEESFSADTFKNALKLFEQWHVLESFVQDGLKVIYLEESYNCCERINDIIARIEDFRK